MDSFDTELQILMTRYQEALEAHEKRQRAILRWVGVIVVLGGLMFFTSCGLV